MNLRNALVLIAGAVLGWVLAVTQYAPLQWQDGYDAGTADGRSTAYAELTVGPPGPAGPAGLDGLSGFGR